MPKQNKRDKKKLILGIVLIIVGGGIIAWTATRTTPRVIIGGDTILVDVADEESEQIQGLSGRQSLAKNRGMLFVYEQPSRPGFWMKDMNFPIDIVWIGQDNRIVAVLPNLSPDTFPEIFSPPEEVGGVNYILEVNAGTVERLQWRIGDQVQVKI